MLTNNILYRRIIHDELKKYSHRQSSLFPKRNLSFQKYNLYEQKPNNYINQFKQQTKSTVNIFNNKKINLLCDSEHDSIKQEKIYIQPCNLYQMIHYSHIQNIRN